MGIMVLVSSQANQLQITGRDFLPLSFLNAVNFKRKRDIRQYRSPWQQAEILKHHAKIFARRLYDIGAYINCPAVRPQESSDHSKQSCLAATAGSEKTYKF